MSKEEPYNILSFRLFNDQTSFFSYIYLGTYYRNTEIQENTRSEAPTSLLHFILYSIKTRLNNNTTKGIQTHTQTYTKNNQIKMLYYLFFYCV